MGSEVSRWVLILLIFGFVFYHATASSEKQNLLKWVHENSDMFVMLKHWNDLPLISTAWKRLKTTPAVQEDRKNFLRSVEYFLELLGDNMQIKLPSLSHSNTSVDTTKTVNLTLEAALLPTNSSMPSSQIPKSGLTEKEIQEAQTNGALFSGLNLQEINTERTTESGRQSSKIDNSSISLSVNNETSLNSCSCTTLKTDSQFDAKSFLKDYEDEKKWIRSQLTPLNYLFDKLKTIEVKFASLQNIPCTTEVNRAPSQEINATLIKGDARTVISQDIVLRIENLELLSKRFSLEYENLTATVLSIQESNKAAIENVEALLSRAASLVPTANLERNSTEDVEYCPERIDEKVPCAEVGNSCYCFSKLQKNWTSALEFCQRNDMLLLSLETQQEAELIANYIKEAGFPRDFYWTSGSDEANEGKWMWISTQKNITLENWRNNQPDGERKENCLYFHSRDEFKWGDWMCNQPNLFICEW